MMSKSLVLNIEMVSPIECKECNIKEKKKGILCLLSCGINAQPDTHKQ
ncbi:MAG: hypothetical protein WCX30_01865 [Candidatus Paceibacterota bacterium]|jgi:hypothetical protein